jgi:hypothetical protein
MGFAIKKAVEPSNHTRIVWEGFTENGNTYQIDEEAAYTLTLLKERIREYHLCKHNGYGERIARRRLEELRSALRAENISYSELADLWKFHEYIASDDVELLEAAGVPENA